MTRAARGVRVSDRAKGCVLWGVAVGARWVGTQRLPRLGVWRKDVLGVPRRSDGERKWARVGLQPG